MALCIIHVLWVQDARELNIRWFWISISVARKIPTTSTIPPFKANTSKVSFLESDSDDINDNSDLDDLDLSSDINLDLNNDDDDEEDDVGSDDLDAIIASSRVNAVKMASKLYSPRLQELLDPPPTVTSRGEIFLFTLWEDFQLLISIKSRTGQLSCYIWKCTENLSKIQVKWPDISMFDKRRYHYQTLSCNPENVFYQKYLSGVRHGY